MESTELTLSTEANNNVFERMARHWVFAACANIQEGHLIIEDAKEVMRFGEPASSSEILARIKVHDASAYTAFILRGTLGAGEAYMDAAWTTPDLLAVVRLMVRNIRWLNQFNDRRPWFYRVMTHMFQKLYSNSRMGAKRNIAAHYDLGNEFFSLFLDSSMMYSAAIYPSEKASLETAAAYKLDTICKKLELKPDDHLLEIGTGWGGMAMHAARHYGCRVTTTTISAEQYKYAREKVEQAGLSDKVTVIQQDYRDLEGKYDKLVSIEMIEAVGYEFYKNYFSTCSRLLKPQGLMLIQAITIPDQRFHSARKTLDFIKRYIFPGGCLPSNAVMAGCVSRYTDMQVIDLQDITEHYASTLAEWYRRFSENIENVRKMGFDKKFCRMWEYYMRYCEGGFRERVISTSQWLIAKPGYRK